MVEKHPVPSVPNGIGAILTPMRIYPHARKSVSPPSESILQRRKIRSEALPHRTQILRRAEGDFQRVVGAVERKFVVRAGIRRPVNRALVVAHLPGKRMNRQKLFRRRMDGGEIGRGARRAVPNRKFQLDADAPRALSAQRCEEMRVERAKDRIFLSHIGGHCIIRRPTKHNRKCQNGTIGEIYLARRISPARQSRRRTESRRKANRTPPIAPARHRKCRPVRARRRFPALPGRREPRSNVS